jgi:hypothetical protein
MTVSNQTPNYQELIDPFEERDVEWRVQSNGVSAKGAPWAMVIPYVTNRAIQQRLDDVFGFDGWKNEYKETADKKGYLCGISIKSGDEWITKWDGSEYTKVEPLKGALSGSMKRAAVQLGIGRYLYNLNEEFAICEIVNARWDVKEPWVFINIKPKNGGANTSAKWLPPVLPDWAQPSFKAEKYLQNIETANTVDELQVIYSDAMKYVKSFKKSDLGKKINEATKNKKNALMASTANQAETKAKELMAWLNKKIVDLIKDAHNEPVVNQALISIKGELTGSCQSLSIKPDVYLAHLKASGEKRINQLNQPKQVEA